MVQSNESNASDQAVSSGSGIDSSQMTIAVGGAVGAAVLGLLLFYLRFCGAAAAPDRPPAPPFMDISAQSAVAEVGASAKVYTQRLADDSRLYRVKPAATVESMSFALAHKAAVRRFDLPPGRGRPVEVAGLRIRAIKRDKMLALEIENLSRHAVAYWVDTKPERGSRRCRGKDDWPHNAMALAPAGRKGSKVVRSECVHKSGSGITVKRVETVELTPLSFFYISRLRPSSVGMSGIAVRSHRPVEGSPCKRTLSATMERQLLDGSTSWRDMIDYYARHSCASYRFPSDYHAVEEDGAIELPVTD